MQKKKILITGGAGFLGSNLVKEFIAFGYDVTATWNAIEPPPLACHWIQFDLLRHQAIKELLLWNSFDYIVHCAALSIATLCETDRKRAYQMNVQATRVLAEESLIHHTKFIFISTDLVFDGSHGWYSEEDPVHPQSYYAETKCLAEQDVRLISPDYFILRVALMYGNYGNALGGFLSWTLDRIMNHEPLNLYLNQFRTILYVQDVFDVIHKLLQTQTKNQTYHLAGTERLNRVEIGKRLIGVFQLPDVNIRPVRLRRSIELGESDDIALLTDKIRSAIDFEFTPVHDGFLRTFQHWAALNTKK